MVAALATTGFRRLFVVRLCGQFGDGVFQASLAGAVLFNPQRQASAADVAAGFALLLMPYSLMGPFAGVLLDRWWRQRILVVANLLRALAVVGVAAEIALGLHGEPFYASALVVLSLSRFFLAALSASLPHVVGPNELVTANALTSTLGAVVTTLGGAAAIGVRLLAASGDGAYGVTALAAAVPYLVSAAVGAGFGRTVLGPNDVERSRRESLSDVARGLVAGARHLHSRRPAFLALAMISVHRLCYGMWAVSTVLLYRNYFAADGVFRSGLAGLAQFVTAAAVGAGLAAVITPTLSRRIGFVRWTSVLLGVSGVIEAGCGLVFRLPAQLLGGLLLAFVAQGVKICVDTQIQLHVLDEFRGRVFAIYDTLFNLAVVAAAVLTALVLPGNGRSPGAVIVVGAAYVVTAIGYFQLAARRPAVIAAVASTTA